VRQGWGRGTKVAKCQALAQRVLKGVVTRRTASAGTDHASSWTMPGSWRPLLLGPLTGGAIDFLHYCRTLGGGKHVSLFC